MAALTSAPGRVYVDRDGLRDPYSGPLVEEAIETLLFPVDGRGKVRLPEPIRLRWQSGEMGFDEKRRVIASVFTCLEIRPGKKGRATWDHSRVVPVWKWADRIGVTEPAV
ncbi:hypothetical protein AB0D94_33030 [Streptomyces sp. NPDC048255]|uniref:hypothetical protein n=1 Tax=Streptomyces sp. NPDC048255 TaxID=3154713 RepID=UPI003410380B